MRWRLMSIATYILYIHHIFDFLFKFSLGISYGMLVVLKNRYIGGVRVTIYLRLLIRATTLIPLAGESNFFADILILIQRMLNRLMLPKHNVKRKFYLHMAIQIVLI